MFIPAAFRVEDTEDFAVARAMTSAAGFGHLVTSQSGAHTGAAPTFESTPLPFLVRDDVRTNETSSAGDSSSAPSSSSRSGSITWSVVGHLARANPMARLGGPALLIVPGPDTYISPSWYPSKAVDGKVVPTWNYEVVHLHGELVIHDDAAWLHALVDDLTERHESSMPNPWSVNDAPDDYLAQMLRGIVGVELVVERVEAKRKLSQNRTETDRDGVLTALVTAPQRGAHAVRAAMTGANESR